VNLQLIDFPAESDFDPIREAELVFALSRRHALPFSVVAIGVGRVVSEADAWREVESTKSIVDRGVEKSLGSLLRITDVLVQCDGIGRYMAFCAGTDARGVSELARRLEQRIDGVRIATGCASFGDEALTLRDLVEVAWSKVSMTPEAVEPGSGNGSGRVRRIGSRRGASLVPSFRRRVALRVKRVFDLAAVIGTAPLWLLTFSTVAAAVKLSDPSAPLFFVQKRTGQGGRRFRMYKFRTMVPNAEAMKEGLRKQNELIWPDFKIKHDPRITLIGRLLRKTSLDELPQLINVLKGDMSLVGPRPTSFEATTYEPWQTARLEAQPGLTGLWQVEGRASTRFDERIRIELEYIARQSFWLDIWILVRTVPAVIKMRGGH
jgi:lipopolysaccharide/colanic/teichoic acid biosynthesis glycosyltransferase